MGDAASARGGYGRQRRVRGKTMSLFDLCNSALMVFLVLVTFYPFYYCIVLSFSEASTALGPGSYLFPETFTLQNYATIFARASSRWRP